MCVCDVITIVKILKAKSLVRSLASHRTQLLFYAEIFIGSIAHFAGGVAATAATLTAAAADRSFQFMILHSSHMYSLKYKYKHMDHVIYYIVTIKKLRYFLFVCENCLAHQIK